MVACFISEVEQDRFLVAEDRHQRMKNDRGGYIPEVHKSLYLSVAVIHNTAYML
jgi:hypothetical protein